MICDNCKDKQEVLYIYPKELLCLICRHDKEIKPHDKYNQSIGSIKNEEICYWTEFVVLKTIKINDNIIILEEY